MPLRFPIDSLESEFRAAGGPRVVTAPPGSGKSTRIPCWLAEDGPVLVVQPRRVAARSLALHLAQLHGSKVGEYFGYAVRGDTADRGAKVLFVTSGVALRLLAGGLSRFKSVVLDEFHERTLDVDLLFAMLHGCFDGHLVVLSATLDGDRVAHHLSGVHLRAEGTMFPVDLRYENDRRDLPSPDQLGRRVRHALIQTSDECGDRLVFVPGKSEIRQVISAIEDLRWEPLGLHGSLSLSQQARVFQTTGPDRVIVATNVAETSITLPRVRVVIDSGLVRRTAYHQDRGYLVLSPIAADSADQRAGRAGRVSPGIAIRLWGERAPLPSHTQPEIYRESLVPLVLAAAAAGQPELSLPFLDPPKTHAVHAAREELRSLGALHGTSLTDRGRLLFGLPLDAHLANLLVEAEAAEQLHHAIPLVAALSSNRPFFTRPPEDPEDDLRDCHCDATALIRAMQCKTPRRYGLDPYALRAAQDEAKRLYRAYKLQPGQGASWDPRTFAPVLIRAWPRSAHIARRRKQRVSWSNGGTEVRLGRNSCVQEEKDACIALSFRAFGSGKKRELVLTAAMPCSLHQLADLGLGRPQLRGVRLERGEIISEVDTVYAGKTLKTEVSEPTGELAVEAIVELLLRGTLWKGFAARFTERYRLVSLNARLEGTPALPAPADLLAQRLLDVGLESTEELALLAEEDLLPPALPAEIVTTLQRDFPPELTLGSDVFSVEVSPTTRAVILHNRGRRLKKPPLARWLPRFRGWSVFLEDRGVRRQLR